MTGEDDQGLLGRARELAARMARLVRRQAASGEPTAGDDVPCCSGVVHIAFRGVSDDRLYLSLSRRWGEVKFFKRRGLKVFCATCRRRLL